MEHEKINSFVNNTMRELFRLGDKISSEIDFNSVNEFKKHFKSIRSWMEFVRINTGDASVRMSEKCKKLYNIVGVMHEVYIHNNQGATDAKWDNLMETARKEWKKTYSRSLLVKLEKQLSSTDLEKIPSELTDNFMANYANARELTSNDA